MSYELSDFGPRTSDLRPQGFGVPLHGFLALPAVW